MNSDVTNQNRIKVGGTANLVLCDGCTLEATTGISVADGNTLNIYAQSEGSGGQSSKAIGAGSGRTEDGTLALGDNVTFKAGEDKDNITVTGDKNNASDAFGKPYFHSEPASVTYPLKIRSAALRISDDINVI